MSDKAYIQLLLYNPMQVLNHRNVLYNSFFSGDHYNLIERKIYTIYPILICNGYKDTNVGKEQ